MRSRGWHALVVPAAVVLVLMAAGCMRRADDGDEQQRMDAIAAEIQASLASRPDVQSAKVKYANYLTTESGTAYVNITVVAGADFAPIVDEAVKLVWQSKLEPLHQIRVGVVDADDLKRGETRHIDPDGQDQAELEREYGPRPK